MARSEQEFLEELRRDFVLEAEEHLQTMASGLLELEKHPDAAGRLVEPVFRAAHSLKGAAHAVQRPRVAAFCQVLEGIFSNVKKGLLALEAGDFDVLQNGLDALQRLVASKDDGLPSGVLNDLERIVTARKAPGASEGSLPEEGREHPVPAPAVVAGLREMGAGVPPDVESTRVPLADTIRIGAARLDDLLLQAEEMVSVTLALEERQRELEALRNLFAPWRAREERLRPLLRHLPNLRDGGKTVAEIRTFLEESRRCFREAEDRVDRLGRSLRGDVRMTGSLVKNLLDGTKRVLMLPLTTLLQGFPRMVRDLSRDLGKTVDLSVSGGDMEVDKRILEGLKDPLIHLIRNAIDHGIESPEERRRNGKPPGGTLALSVARLEGSRVEIGLSDDGRGIDPAGLRAVAVREGMLSEEDARNLDDAGALRLVFRSGLSTSPILTDLSGRGVGMAIVAEGVERLGGQVSIVSEQRRGTTVRMVLPLTLASFRGVLVQEWGHRFVVPTANVDRVARVERCRIRRVEHRESVEMGGVPLALVRLGQVLGLHPPAAAEGPSRRFGTKASEAEEWVRLVVLSAGETVVAFSVDRVLSEQEVLLKDLGPQLLRVRHVAGATVLGSGAVVPILNPADLIRTAVRGVGSTAVLAPDREASRRISVLVAEDSITSRTLLANILTAAGYDVRTAVDGAEAWEALQDHPCDLLVSDVEMPRMNGFDLTARLRGEPRFAEIPVVLVTSLESREDRERGVEVGANAYIVKSSFDQGNLLEVLQRLV